MTEVDRSLPEAVRKQRKQEDEVNELGRALRKECVHILSSHGVLTIGRYFSSVESGTWKNMSDDMLRDIEPSERDAYWHVEGEAPVLDNDRPLNVSIISLGKSSPEKAKHIIIDVPELSFHGAGGQIIIADSGGASIISGRVKGTIFFVGMPDVDEMREFSQAVGLLRSHFENTSLRT